jgi:LacI family repressor for deo operon, udp, cdd, tsx, nupC, and nupG
LGVIVREIADPFFAHALEVIAGEARRHHYNLVLGHARSSGEEALALAGVLETRHCDGIILLGDLKNMPGVWEDLSNAPLPLVALCQGSRAPGIPTINTDNGLGTVKALEYLFTQGHRRMAFVDAGWLGDIGERRTAFTDWISGHGLVLHDGYLQSGENDPGSGSTAFERLMALSVPPTAIICATDQLALGVLAAASKRGVSVPDTVSVIGFDDIHMAQFAVPALTTLRQPLEDMARFAVEQILAVINGEQQIGYRRLCEPDLIVRGSCSVPPTRSHWPGRSQASTPRG